MKEIGLIMRRAYVPVASIVLTLIVGNWLAESYAFDPLTAAQNHRLSFQKGGDSALAAGGLTRAEEVLAEAVLETNRPLTSGRTSLLYVGNSQVLAIMDRQPGDIITPQWLQILLARQHRSQTGIDVHLAAEPNITLTELLIKLVAAGEQSPRQVDILLAAAVLEEFRGLGVRAEIATTLESGLVRAGLVSLLEKNTDLPAARKAIEPFLNPGKSSPAVANSSESSVAAAVERKLQSAAESVPLFAKRQNLLVAIDLTYNAWRDRLLGITSSAARPVPPAAYAASLELLELALRYAQTKNIQVVFYLAPIRLGVSPNPNVPGDVARFRRDVPELCRRYDVFCFDYVDLVPEALWTNYPDAGGGMGTQRDFAHFTGAAHKLLAEKLVSDMDLLVTRSDGGKRPLQP